MMITRRIVVSLRQPLLRGQVRHQGSAALNNETSSKSKATPPPIRHHMQSATIASTPRSDLSSMALKRDSGDYYFEEHSEALLSAFNVYDDMQESEQRVTATARDMDLIEAALAVRDVESYDKILILMRHGEAKHNAFEREHAQKYPGSNIEDANEDENYPVDPMLTGKGCGTMLNLSNRTATYFNKETGLQPDLFVVSPLRRAIQSALISFPHDAPLTSLSGTPWICHPACMEQANGNKSEFVSSPEELEGTFPGVDYGLFKQSLMRGDVYNSKEKVSLFESKMDLMNRSDAFLEWIKGRDERVIVISSHATWLQSFCAFSLQYEDSGRNNLEMFKKGEMKSVGIKFS